MQSLNRQGRTGLWVPCEGANRFLDSLEGIETLMALLVKKQVTDVFLQVFRGGRAWFPSKLFESGCKDSKLLELLEKLKEQKISAHAWVNVCNAGMATSQKFTELIGGQSAYLQDGFGRDTLSDLAAFQIDTPGLWLEPSNPLLHSTFKALVAELNQLNFVGLHLDFIRYPYCLPIKPASWIDCGIDFGYSQNALEKFQATQKDKITFIESKKNGLIPDSETNGQKFDDWRRQQIKSLVQTFKQALLDNRKLSVAALACSDRAYLSAYQDWRIWLESELIDSLCLMSYTADNQFFTELIKVAKAFMSPQQKLFAGVGLYKLSSQSELSSQLEILKRLNVDPCYFCADRLLLTTYDH